MVYPPLSYWKLWSGWPTCKVKRRSWHVLWLPNETLWFWMNFMVWVSWPLRNGRTLQWFWRLVICHLEVIAVHSYKNLADGLWPLFPTGCIRNFHPLIDLTFLGQRDTSFILTSMSFFEIPEGVKPTTFSVYVYSISSWWQPTAKKYGANSSYASYDQSQQIGKTASRLKMAYLASSRKGGNFLWILERCFDRVLRYTILIYLIHTLSAFPSC